MIEPGIYTGTLQSIEFGKSSNGTPTIAIEWFIEAEDTYRTSYWYISLKAKKNTFKKLKFIGFNGDFQNPEATLESTDLRCKIEPYTNPDTGDEEDKERWDLARWGGAGVEAADKKTAKDLNAQWRKDVGAPAKKKKAAPDPEPDPEPEPEAEAEAPAAPPPAKKNKPAADSKTPREQAWDAFIEHKITEKALKMLEDGKSSKAVMEWTLLIDEAVADKEEEDFEAADWEIVKQYIEVPF